MINRLHHIPLVLTLLVSLTGCGFHSIYGAHNHDSDDSLVADDLNQVAIDSIPQRNGQIMRNDLIDAMYSKGRPAQPSYRLKVTLRPTEEDLGIQADATTTRTMVNMYADFILFDAKDKEILRGMAHSVSNFNKISDQYATLAAREDVYGRTINECSEQIVSRIGLYFSEQDEKHVAAQP